MVLFTHHRERQRPWTRVVCSARKLSFSISIILVSYLALIWFTIGVTNDAGALPRDGNEYRVGSNHSQHWKSVITSNSVITIGIVSTITGCGSDPFTEGAAVLKYSIDLTSIHGPKGGKYNYKMYIMYHPDAVECALPLMDLGFELVERQTPVNVSDIQGDILRERIVRNGCCGERELIKLEAFRLIQHPLIIHLDLDVLVLRPMDPAIDLMLQPSLAVQEKPMVESFLMWPEKAIPEDISLMFTKDYNIVGPRRMDKPFQGGFFMIKPNLDTYNEFIQIVREGDYRDQRGNSGWGGVVGPFYGGMTIQGLLPWYYEHLHPGRAVELNRCLYNNMADNPTTEPAIHDVPQGLCRTNQEKCEDCRNRSLEEIVTFHYTVCYKPWRCSPQRQNTIEMRLCHQAHHEWFKYRRDLEMSWSRSGNGSESFMYEHFFGHCKFAGPNAYQRIRSPYGRP